MNLEDEYSKHFPNFKRSVEGHCKLTERTIQFAKDIYEVVKPKSMLEIGFNAGHSAFMWLTLFPELKFHSVDICKHNYTLSHMKKLKEAFGDRFTYGKGDSKVMNVNFVKHFDLVFIDGDHSYEGILGDYNLCDKAKSPWILIDDYRSGLKYPTLLCDNIKTFENHSYEWVDKFHYHDQSMRNTAVLFKRKEDETV